MKKTNESGRSMVEMLGVLAIIGVLSVGGIAGYTMAMRKYKANEIAQAIAMLAMEATTANMGTGVTGTLTYKEALGAANPTGTDAADANFNANATHISVITESNELCNAVKSVVTGGTFSDGDCDDETFTVQYTAAAADDDDD